MTQPIRWGIIGTGNIAHQFATGLQSVDDADLVAVGSRSPDSADAFGNEFEIPNRHASYEALASDPDVDVVYIATPHPYHKENTLLCLENNKHVLCEKPFTINADDAKIVIDAARERGLFLMEAMWTRFLPVMVKVRELIADGAIGDPMLVQADFGFRMAKIVPEHRLFNPYLGGGALLDVGIYPVSLASMIFGKQPEQIATLSHLGETNVDELSAMVFTYDHNEMTVCTTAIRVNTAHEARIYGSRGQIHIPNWWRAREFTLVRDSQEPETMNCGMHGNGYNYEAAEAGRCIREGKLESEIMPLDETLAIMQTLDTIRAEWALKYPSE